jgi:hypothetical protein
MISVDCINFNSVGVQEPKLHKTDEMGYLDEILSRGDGQEKAPQIWEPTAIWEPVGVKANAREWKFSEISLFRKNGVETPRYLLLKCFFGLHSPDMSLLS